MGRKTVYVPLEADLLHHGHVNIIKVAAELGDVIVGLYTDKAISEFGMKPILPYEDRKIIAANIRGVTKVVPQETADCSENIIKLMPKLTLKQCENRHYYA